MGRDQVHDVLIVECYIFGIELWEDRGIDRLLGVFNNLGV